MLYLVATPIGNLSDITIRAVEILRTSDYILCEDTRHSKTLLDHYGIEKTLKSFHKFNENFKADAVIEDLKEGKSVALISDAGTPGISDPGTPLVQRCIAEGIKVIAIPGPCAAIAALSCSGCDTDRFQFFGFLPKKQGELQKALQEILIYPGTTVCYESPFRLLDVLKCLEILAPERPIAIARELTKKFEEVKRGTAGELWRTWEDADKNVKGEIVLMISGNARHTQAADWLALTPEEHVQMLIEEYQISQRDAIKMAAELRGVPKRTIYKHFID